MSELELGPDARELIRQSLESIDHVEVLLALHRAPGRAMTAPELSAALHIDAKSVARSLRDLESASLAASDAQAWRYVPQPPRRQAAVDELALAYDQRPLVLVRALQSRPSSVLRFFVDSFRFRGED